MILTWLALLLAGVVSAYGGDFEGVYDRLYSFDFPAAHVALDTLEQSTPGDPLVPATRAAAHLFSEFDRLGILASEFFQDRGQKLQRTKLEPSAEVRADLFRSLGQARQLAERRLEVSADDADAHFVLAVASGIECDYAVFVEKKRLDAVPLAKDAHAQALRTLEIDQEYFDAQLITGINEYMLGSIPILLRWMIHIDGVKGDKQIGIERLETVSRKGRYLKPFAKILLAAIHQREKRFAESGEVLRELVREFPENPLFRRELAELDGKPGTARRAELSTPAN